MSEPKRRIDDAGAFIPGAVKHAFSGRESQKQSSLKLKDLWPEPNWEQALTFGGAPENVLLFYCVYHSMRTTPPPHSKFGHYYTKEQLQEMYVTAVNKAKMLFQFAIKRKDVITKRTLKDVWYRQYGLDPEKMRKRDHNFYFEDLLPIHALGRGNGRTIKHITHFLWVYDHLLKYGRAMGFPSNMDVLKYKIYPIALKHKRTKRRFYRVAEFNGTQALYVDDTDYTDEKEALRQAYVLNQKHMAEAAETDGKKKPPRGFFYKKSRKDLKPGDPSRLKRDLTAEDHIKYFGLRGLQFGNSMSDAERQRWLNNVGLALLDLGRIIGLSKAEMHALSVGGVAFAYGARGRGRASAHFEPGQRVINLTRQSGPSAIAHEWAHLFDHGFPSLNTNKQYVDGEFTSSLAFGLGEHFLDEFRNVGQLERCMVALMKDIEHSNFYQSARRIQGQSGAKKGYWTAPEELFARAFESYIEDKLGQLGIVNEWLVFGTIDVSLPPEHIDKNPYPEGRERALFFNHFEQLMPLVKRALLKRFS